MTDMDRIHRLEEVYQALPDHDYRKPLRSYTAAANGEVIGGRLERLSPEECRDLLAEFRNLKALNSTSWNFSAPLVL